MDQCWQAHLASRDLKRRVLMVSVILRPTVLKRLPLMGAPFKAAFTDDLGARAERLNEAMGLLAGVAQGMGFRRLTVSSGEWLELLGGLIGQPVVKSVSMKGQVLAEGLTKNQVLFTGKRVEIETSGAQRFGAIFGVKSYPARAWARMLDAPKHRARPRQRRAGGIARRRRAAGERAGSGRDQTTSGTHWGA